MSSNIYIDNALCTSCGTCAKECGHHTRIQGSSHVDPESPKCGGCLHCYTVCPQNAIKLKKVDDTALLDAGSTSLITDVGLISFLAYRRSTRSFQKKAVEDSIIEKLINSARYIPSGGNAHSYEFTVLKSDRIKAGLMEELTRIYRLRSHLLNNPLLKNAAKPFVNKQMRSFLKDKNYGNRVKDLVNRLYTGDDPFFHNAPVIIIIHSRKSIPTPKEDCVLAGYNICLVAQSLGLGTCFVTLAQNAINTSKECKKILDLDIRDNVNAVITLGYPETHHLRIAPKPEKEIHWR